MGSLKDKTAQGLVWKLVEKLSTFGITYVFGILMARLLMPADYGLVGMIGIFLAVSQTFADSGFGTALIRKVDRTQTDLSTVFYFSTVISVILYLILWFCAPLIADFYDQPLLTPITRAMGLTLIVGSIAGIQSIRLTVDLDFKSLAKISVTSNVLGSIAGYVMARCGFGVWAIVGQILIGRTLTTVLLWFFGRWMPSLVFSWKSFRELFSFGSKLLASALLDTIYNNVYTLVIGKVYSAKSLGYYSQASGLASVPALSINGMIQSVTFPVLAKIQNERERLHSIYRRFICLGAFMVFPLLIGLAAIAKPLILFMLGERWLPSAIYLQLLCFVFMWYPVHSLNLNLLQVLGRSDYFLKLEIIKKIQGVVVLCITVPMGLTAMCVGSVISSFISLICNTYYTRRLINYGFFDQMRDLFPILANCFVMAVIVWGIGFLLPTPLLQTVVGIVVGGVYYLVSAQLLRWDAMTEAIDMVRRVFSNIHFRRRPEVSPEPADSDVEGLAKSDEITFDGQPTERDKDQ